MLLAMLWHCCGNAVLMLWQCLCQHAALAIQPAMARVHGACMLLVTLMPHMPLTPLMPCMPNCNVLSNRESHPQDGVACSCTGCLCVLRLSDALEMLWHRCANAVLMLWQCHANMPCSRSLDKEPGLAPGHSHCPASIKVVLVETCEDVAKVVVIGTTRRWHRVWYWIPNHHR
jgi:hypothetical protein